MTDSITAITEDQVKDVLSRLVAVPTRIARSVQGWSDAQLRAPTAPGEWSVAQILAHLRAGDDIIAYRAYMMMVRENPLLQLYDAERWVEAVGFAALDFHDSLRLFTLRRAELVNMLRRAALEDWKRTGTHEKRGTITLFDVVTTLVEHEDEHCLQLEELEALTPPAAG